MALSQIQCLDDNHVNPRINESKPDFLYSEDQRLALEVLLSEGRDAFLKFVEERQMRSFLSDLEQETLTKRVEPYDPGSELFPEDADENEPPLSVHYWPDLSDMSIPQMDLGWPHTDAYRGVTRTTVYTQPPLEGQTHIKEIVRRMIAHAQKVIAVVMDVFTDVDIFRDLLDAAFRRKVAIYIMLERTSLPHFLSMCQRASMHAGHLKHLRVRCTEGMEFYSRSCTKVKGRLGHRFMFIDGDKAVSGSFSFTWMSSRLDKNLVTVVTGQAVEAFDHLFRHLYAGSTFVDLQQVAMEPEPEREPLLHIAPVVLPSATITRNLYNPKYALLIGESANSTSAEQDPPKESQTPEVPDSKKRKRGKGSKEPMPEDDCTHPGLVNLEKANLIPYLPTWPEPDPPSDVIGFINIMDTSKPTQVHLQRSERFETSQAIRFTNPLTMRKEPPPEVAKPKEISSAIEDKTNPSPSQDRIKPSESIYDRLQRVDSTNAKAEKVEQRSATSRFEQTIHTVSPTGQNEGQITKRMSPLSGNIDHISRSSTGNHEHASEQKPRIAPQTETSSSLAKQVSNLPITSDSNLGTEYTETKTTPHLMRANHTQPCSASKSSPDSHTLDTSHLSSSSPLSPNHPTLKPHTVHSATKDRSITNGPGTPNMSTHKKLNSPTANRVASHKSTGENTHDIINRKTGVQKEERTSDAFQKNQQNQQKESAADSQNNKSGGLHDGKGGTPGGFGNTKPIQSDASATLAPNRDKKITSGDIKTVRPIDCDSSSKPQDDLVKTESKATSRQLTDPKSPQTLNETQSEMKTYHIKENKPQRITYGQSSPLTMWERIQAATVGLPSDGIEDTSAQPGETTTNSPKKNTRRVSQDSPQSPKEKPVARQPEKAVQSAERQLRSTASDRRTSDDYPPRLPPPALSPDLPTPTSDIRDGYRSRKDSNRSTTSEDHVESCGSPSKEHIIERVTHSGHSTADQQNPEDDQSNKSIKDATSPVFIDYSAYVALFDNKTKHTSSKESQGLERKVKMRDKEDVKSKDGGIRKTLNRDSKGKEGRNGNEESKPKPFEKEKETSNQALLRKSRTQRATGSGNAENRDGSAREVAGQKV